MKVTDEMIEVFGKAWHAEDERDTLVDGARRRAGLQAVLDHIERESISFEPFVTWAAVHCTTEDTDAWNEMVDAWEKLPNAIRTRLLEGRKA